jgi:putative glycosyltransferase
MKISIVTSLYKSEKYISAFYTVYKDNIQKLNLDYEFVFVNDGSPDNSIEVVKRLIEKDDKVKLVVLSRNFGQYPAMFAALAFATGDYIYTSDVDLEEPPANLELMWRMIQNEPDADVVMGIARIREGGLVKSYLGNIFFNILSQLSEIPIEKNQTWQRLMSKRYVDALMQFKEQDSLPMGLMALTGYKQKTFLMDKHYKGSSSYDFKKRFWLSINALTSFSSLPLLYITFVGFAITLLAFLFVIIIVFSKLFLTNYQAGWTSLIASIWLVGGIIITAIGVVGVYVSKIFNQVKNRPLYIVQEVIQKSNL